MLILTPKASRTREGFIISNRHIVKVSVDMTSYDDDAELVIEEYSLKALLCEVNPKKYPSESIEDIKVAFSHILINQALVEIAAESMARAVEVANNINFPVQISFGKRELNEP